MGYHLKGFTFYMSFGEIFFLFKVLCTYVQKKIPMGFSPYFFGRSRKIRIRTLVFNSMVFWQDVPVPCELCGKEVAASYIDKHTKEQDMKCLGYSCYLEIIRRQIF